MCFILALFQVNKKYPLIVAANRDEARARPSTVPHLWPDTPGIRAGRDDVAGGTWLGVNRPGVLVAITNRRAPGKPDPTFPSRGQLCLATLWQPDLSAALATVESDLSVRSYNPFNLLCATVQGGSAVTWQGKRRLLTPGVHVLTNHGDLDNPEDPAIPRALAAASQIDLTEQLELLLVEIGNICTDQREPNPIYRPDGERGTVSSSLIALDETGRVAAYWHADGPPSNTQYQPLDLET